MEISKKLLTLAGGIALAAGISTAAQAGNVNVGGVVVPDGTEALAQGYAFINVDTNNFANSTIIGNVVSIGPAPAGIPITWSSGDNGIELTYVFTINSVSIIDALHVSIDSATLNYYTDGAQDFDPLSVASAGPGNLWVSAALQGSEVINLDPGNGTITAANELEFDVVGGPFADKFDSDAFANLSDILTLSLEAHLITSGIYQGLYQASTHTTFLTVPEPATLGLFGIGLIGLGALSRRRKAA